jgi:hypothetical protein
MQRAARQFFLTVTNLNRIKDEQARLKYYVRLTPDVICKEVRFMYRYICRTDRVK